MRVAPRASAPSRIACGTDDSASSESEATIGMMRMPITRPADSALKMPRPSNSGRSTFGVTKLMAKKPNTTVGMPARTSSTGLRTLRAWGLAYSDRYRAAPRPSGMATTIAMPVMSSVALRIGSTP